MLIVSSHEENAITRIDPESGKTRWSQESRYGKPAAPAVSPDKRMIAVGTGNGQILLLDAETGKEVHEPLAYGTQLIWSVRFSPDRLLVAVGEDGKVGLWDTESFNRIELPDIHQEDLYAASFSADGQILVTAGGYTASDPDPWNHNGEICVWSVKKRELLAKFHAHYGCVTCVVFTPDGKKLATTGRDGKVYLWNVDEILEFSRCFAEVLGEFFAVLMMQSLGHAVIQVARVVFVLMTLEQRDPNLLI